MKRPKKHTTKGPGWRTVAAMVAPVWLVPALLINVSWAEGVTSPWNVAAAASIIATAVFVAAACQAKTRVTAASFVVAATLLTTTNFMLAFTNATHRTNDGRDDRATRAATIERLTEQRSQLSQARSSATIVAGGKPTASIVAEIDATIAAHAGRWAATNQCKPASVTAPASMVFCGHVAQLRGQLAGARERDAIGAQIVDIDRKTSEIGSQVSGEPLTEGVSSLASAVGISLPGGFAAALPAIRDGLRALTLEMIAALGPAAWMMLCFGSQTASAAKIVPVRADRKPVAVVSGDDVAAFIAARLVRTPGGCVRAGDAYEAWQAWCQGRGADPGTQKRFGRALARNFRRDQNNGRPRYLGAVIRDDDVATPDREAAQVLRFARA